ncbi:MAG: Na+/H+ antiporter [Rhodoferax sp.]|uniref:Na+/H+ antiporter n=1 Tax=Rhodoferax sp. TaxID=50421 RepID=UPI0032666F16
MHSVTITLLLLLAVVLSDLLSRALESSLPFTIPKPLIQVAFGVVMGLFPSLVVTLEPGVFFLLLLAPLLFLDGWRIPGEELLKDRGSVVQLALGLVVLAVLGIGLFVHALIPAIPLPVAFALAAVLSPTDPIAVSAIARRVPMPPRMMRILEGESLLNDASGLVCFKLALAAMLTGSFSVQTAILNFAWLAVAGVVTGVGLTLLLTTMKNAAARRLGEDSGAQILISLLIPFGCYMLAERLGGSGVLAAVAGGLTMSVVESSGKASATTRIRRSTFWDVISFAANGAVFVLLGEQLHGIVEEFNKPDGPGGGPQSLAWLGLYVVAITAALVAIRFAWVFVSLRLRLFRRNRTPDALATPQDLTLRMIAVMSLAGVRGAVSLAGVLGLPLMLPGGAPFPARTLVIALAMGVIALSLVLAAVALPLLLNSLVQPADTAQAQEEDTARLGSARAAVAAIESLERERPADHPDAALYTAAAARLLALYRTRMDNRDGSTETLAQAQRVDAIEREMRLAALRAERSTLFRELRARRLGSSTARKLVRELDLLEARQLI